MLVKLQIPEPKPGVTIQEIQEAIERVTGHRVYITDLWGVMYIQWLHSPKLLETILQFTDGARIASEVQ